LLPILTPTRPPALTRDSSATLASPPSREEEHFPKREDQKDEDEEATTDVEMEVDSEKDKARPRDEDKEEVGGEVPDPERVPSAMDFPDGGLRAYACVVGGAATLFATFGLSNTWGAIYAE
jgi:hypothetical protein